MLCLLFVTLFEISYAQEQNYTFSDDSFTYLVRIYTDVSIGDTVFGFNTYDEGVVDYANPLSIVEYEHAGIDATGTLHLVKDDNDYLLDDNEVTALSVKLDETLTFLGGLTSPNLEVLIQEAVNSTLSVTLVNADAFEVFVE